MIGFLLKRVNKMPVSRVGHELPVDWMATTDGPALQFTAASTCVMSAHFEEAQSVLPVVTEKYVFQATLTLCIICTRRCCIAAPQPWHSSAVASCQCPGSPALSKFTICVRYVIVLALLDTPRDQGLPRNDTSARAPMSTTVTATVLQRILVRHHGLVAPL